MNKFMKIMLVVYAIGIAVTFLWNQFPIIKDSVHFVLDPTMGSLLGWNVNIGFIIIMLLFSLITTLAQKYFSDQDALKTLKEEQKLIQQEIKLYRQDPKKTAELTSKSFELTMKTMPITMRPTLYTMLPFLLTFKWFYDYFTINPIKILGMHWLLAYFVIILVSAPLFKKILKVH
jgi:uncharacterized membrane protein (DUF106 family)